MTEVTLNADYFLATEANGERRMRLQSLAAPLLGSHAVIGEFRGRYANAIIMAKAIKHYSRWSTKLPVSVYALSSSAKPGDPKRCSMETSADNLGYALREVGFKHAALSWRDTAQGDENGEITPLTYFSAPYEQLVTPDYTIAIVDPREVAQIGLQMTHGPEGFTRGSVRMFSGLNDLDAPQWVSFEGTNY